MLFFLKIICDIKSKIGRKEVIQEVVHFHIIRLNPIWHQGCYKMKPSTVGSILFLAHRYAQAFSEDTDVVTTFVMIPEGAIV